jgi:hypothetical protein
MMTVATLRTWLRGHGESEQVAIDDDGLTLIVLDADGRTTGEYLEIGGVPDADLEESHGLTHEPPSNP